MDYSPLKSEPWRAHLIVGDDKLDYEFDVGSPTTSLLDTKLLINSAITDVRHGDSFMSLDIKDLFLSSPMLDAEFIRIPSKFIPQDIMKRHNFHQMTHNGSSYSKLNKGMHVFCSISL